MSFPNEVFDALDIAAGTLLGPNPLVGVQETNNLEGYAILAIARIGTTEVPTSPGSFATLTLRCKEGASPGQYELKLGVAVAAVVFGGTVGVGLTVLARRFTPRPRMFFLGVSVLGLILYGILAFVRSEEASTAIWLNAMHIAAAVPIVVGLMRLLPRQRDA